jgi:hypothetical protein
MGFFNKIFGKTNNTEEISTSLDLLPTILQNNFISIKNNLELESAKNISEIKYLFERAKNLLEDIQSKELVEKENIRFNKAALTSKKQIEAQLKKTLEKTNPNKLGNELNEIRAYSNENYALMINEINSFRKNIAYTSVYLKDEMKILGETLQEIINLLAKMNIEFSKNSGLFEFEKIIKRIDNIKCEEKILQENKKIILKEKEKIEEKNIEGKKIEEKIEEIEKREDFIKIDLLEKEKSELFEKKQQLRIEVSSMLSTIEKPLQRFNSLVKSKRWIINNEKEEVLQEFLNNPLQALKKDLNGAKFKEILKEVKKAIEEEKIDLKEKEKEKRLNALQELISFDFFENVFWKLNGIQKRKNEIETLLKENQSLKEKNNLNLEKNQILKEKELINENIRQEEMKKTRILEFMEKEKNIIKEYSEKILGKKIILEK